MPKGTGIVYSFEARTRSTVGTHSESVAVLVVRRMVAAVGAWAQRTRLRSQRREASRKLCAPPKIPKVKLLRHRISTSIDSSLVLAGVIPSVISEDFTIPRVCPLSKNLLTEADTREMRDLGM